MANNRVPSTSTSTEQEYISIAAACPWTQNFSYVEIPSCIAETRRCYKEYFLKLADNIIMFFYILCAMVISRYTTSRSVLTHGAQRRTRGEGGTRWRGEGGGRRGKFPALSVFIMIRDHVVESRIIGDRHPVATPQPPQNASRYYNANKMFLRKKEKKNIYIYI